MHVLQAAYLRRLASVAETREIAGALAVRTGIPSNTENGVVSTVAQLEPDAILELVDWLADVPASWVALDPALGSSLVAAGCTPEDEAWNMRGEIGEIGPPEHEVRPVRSAAELEEWLAIVRECGWYEDVEPARRLYEALGCEGLYLAADGAASAFFAPPTVLLDTVAVRPRRQRRGIGRSLALVRLRDARARGCTEALLAPSPQGRRLYASLGFRLEPQPPGHWFYLPAPRSEREEALSLDPPRSVAAGRSAGPPGRGAVAMVGPRPGHRRRDAERTGQVETPQGSQPARKAAWRAQTSAPPAQIGGSRLS